ncbi:MAG: T9SS type A sorting domain-containing protein [Saprospiraceae bacterium]
MNSSYIPTGVCVFLSFAGSVFLKAQSTGPEFLDCSTTPTSLCVSDDGVTLPPNNKIYLGEENPNASSCNVHVIQKTKVRSTCGKNLQYEVQLFLEEDTSTAIILQPLTTITTDSVLEAELSFNSALSPDSVIRRNGIPYTSGCMRYHRIKWIVTDSCGEIAVCETQIELHDCSKPFLSNQSNLYIIESDVVGFAHIHLDSIIKDPKDDCTFLGGFLYSLLPEHFQPDSTIYLCDIPAWGVELPYNIWVADGGHDINCDGIIEWSERNIEKQQIQFVFRVNGWLDCGGGDPGPIAGEILTEDVQSIEKVIVTMSQQGQNWPPYTTMENGKFSFSTYQTGLETTLEPIRNDNYRNGVSTLDLVRIKKHLLGIESLSSAYDIIAADANNNHSISVLDLVELRKLILGIYSELPANKSWRFVPKDFIFPDPSHPWPFPETFTFIENGGGGKYDFIGIKIGDVNNTVQANAQQMESRNAPQMFNLDAEEKQYAADEIVEISFYTRDLIPIQGFQFTLSDPDLEFLSASSEKLDLTEANYALFDDKMTLSWFKEDGFLPVRGEVLFTVKARAKRNGDVQENLTINSDITEAELYGMNDEIFTPVLSANERTDDDHLILFAPEPNPWIETTTIPFYVKEPGSSTFKIFDINGQLIYEREGICETGNNEINISSSDFTTRGLLYYCVKTAASSSVRKMIVLK